MRRPAAADKDTWADRAIVMPAAAGAEYVSLQNSVWARMRLVWREDPKTGHEFGPKCPERGQGDNRVKKIPRQVTGRARGVQLPWS